jgi:hypothetical protein
MMLPPRPERFLPARGIQAAAFSEPPELKQRRYTGRRLQGIRYERSVHEHLAWRYGRAYCPSPWIKFFAEGKWRWCQPDGLLFVPALGKIIIVEIKYQHTTDAWWQVRHLYQPVLEFLMPPRLWKYEVCEVVKWYDPAVVFPESLVLANEVDMPHAHFKVHICKP